MMQKLRVLLTQQFVVYIVGGVLSAVVDVGVMQMLIAQHYVPVIAASAGFIAGLLVNYAFHAKVTFKNVTSPATFARFMCLVGINYLITIGIVAVGVAWWQSALIGKIASMPIVALNGFLLSKYWIYK